MLNPKLFEAVKTVFGEPILVANSDRVGEYSLPKKTSVCFTKNQKEYAQVGEWGECYRVNCPECGDSRQRLYFSHMFGTKLYPKDRKTPIFFSKTLVHCFNENCHRTLAFREWLDKLDEQDIQQITIEGAAEKPSKKTFTKYLDTDAVLPSPNYPIVSDDLPGCVYDFLEERRFDAHELDSLYMCRFIPQGAVWKNDDTEIVFKEDRLLIPIMQRRKLVSWQARKIVNTDDKQKKYIFEPGCKAVTFLYNMDRAWKFKNVVICEGVTDVWRIGEDEKLSLGAVALLGKNLSKMQMSVMKTLWGYDGRGIVMLDSDAKKECTTAYNFLKAYKIFPKGVKIIYLENGDPSDLSRKELLEQIGNAIKD